MHTHTLSQRVSFTATTEFNKCIHRKHHHKIILYKYSAEVTHIILLCWPNRPSTHRLLLLAILSMFIYHHQLYLSLVATLSMFIYHHDFHLSLVLILSMFTYHHLLLVSIYEYFSPTHLSGVP